MTDKTKREGQPFERRPLIYGRAKGKALSRRQQQLFETLLPQVAFPLRTSASDPAIDPHTVFPELDAIHLEVGFGGGEHLVARARANPRKGFIGCEPFMNGVAKVLAAIDEEDLPNIRVHHGDARDVIDSLTDASLDRAYVLYPDPWPKARHNKRRFIGPDTLASLARVIRPGGILEVASDIPDYIRWTLAETRRDGHFLWTANSKAEWETAPQDWPGTRYEAKAIREGRTPCYLEFIRAA
jgi:tRNA (guanine-N7-)-methyltransferase